MHTIKKEHTISQKDIKCIVYLENIVAVAGREETITILNKDTLEKMQTIYPQSSYINSLAITKIQEIIYIVVGTQKGSIIVFKSDDGYHKQYLLTGHTQNVCSLDIYNSYLLSGSWDGKAKIWDLTCFRELFNFSLEFGAIWSAKFFKKDLGKFSPTDFVVGCAQKTICIYKGGSFFKSIKSSLSAIRGVVIWDNFIYSICNDGKVMKNNINSGKLISTYDLEDFFYSITVSEDNLIVVTGENGKVVLFDLNLKILSFLKSNAQSCWCSIFAEKKLFVGGSNGSVIEIEGRCKEKIADLNENKVVQDSKEENFDSNEKSECFLKKEDSLSNKSKQAPSTPLDSNYKIENGRVFYFDNNQWNLIGDVVDQEKKYDHSFDVEVEGKFLKINFNEKDDIFNVADRFLKENNLSANYKDEIVQFIRKNFKPKEDYYIYNEFNIENMKKYTNDEFLKENFTNPMLENNEKIEDILKTHLKNMKDIAFVFDSYRFFISKNFLFDFCFLQDCVIDEKKTAMAFMKLLINLYKKQPFNLEILKDKVDQIIDYGLLGEKIIVDYRKNREIAMKK